MKATIFQTLFFLFAGAVLTSASCRNGGIMPGTKTPSVLVERFSNGEISLCTLDGNKVYHCRLNANDAGSEIYGIDTEKIATCNSAWGQKPDPVCSQLLDCKVLYRVENNIWGLEPINKSE